jgi:nitrite reductase (cytochrome c-552)
MPYRSEGGVKFTNHKIMSPLQDVAGSCQVCHRESEANLVRDVYERQDKIEEMRMRAESGLAKAHIEAKFAWDKGATEKEMAPVLTLIRQSQWRWDWVAAANGLGFHSPVEAARTLGASIGKAEQARTHIVRILARHGYTDEIPLPDISTKARAQAYIGLDMEKFKAGKKEFLATEVPKWDAAAKARQAKY